MAKSLALFLVIIVQYQGYVLAQNEQSKWYFGDHAALDFLNNGPTPIFNSVMFSYEGCASIADASGNLLFYTGGDTVFNSNHQVMANGGNILGGHDAVQSSLIIKDINAGHLYHLFTIVPFVGSLAHSVVDMTLAAGTGSVTIKNVVLEQQVGERLHGTRHCNGRDYWVVAHRHNTNEFLAYLLTPGGLSAPVISAIGPSNLFWVGAIKVSPMGNKIGLTDISTTTLFDFDNATGQITNPLLLDTIDTYGCEFSADGTKFYAGQRQARKVVQWDLCSTTDSALLSSRIIIYDGQQTTNSTGNLQLGPDKKIYVTFDGFLNSISVIHFPHLASTSCSYTSNSVSLGNKKATRSLPNFIVERHKPLATLSNTSQCGQSSFSYSLPPLPCNAPGYVTTGIKWIFGDSIAGGKDTSFSNTPNYNYSKNGTYIVRLIINYACASDTFKKTIIVNDLPNLGITGRMKICKKETTTLTASGANLYTWGGGQQTNSIVVNPTVTTIYTLTSSNNTCQASKQVTVTVNECLGILVSESAKGRIYPNPATNYLMVEGLTGKTAKVVNLLGQTKMTLSVNQEIEQIDIGTLPKGVYILESADGARWRFAKE
jgi:hypothetical protein